MNKLKVLLLITSFVLVGVYPLKTFAEAPQTIDAPIFMKSIQDDSIVIPPQLKPAHDVLKKYTSDVAKYSTQKSDTIKFILSLSQRDIDNQQKAKGLALEIDGYIKKLNSLKKQKDSFSEDSFNKLISDKSFLTSLDSFFNAFDGDQFRKIDNAEHASTIEMLYSAKNFYTYISKSKYRFDSINGYMSFENPTDKYEYWSYLAKTRNAFKSYIFSETDELKLLQTNKDVFVKVLGEQYYNNLSLVLEGDKKLTDAWSKINDKNNQPTNSGVNEVNVGGEFEARQKANASLQDVISQINNLNDEYYKYGAYSKERFSSKENLKKALSLSQQMLALYNKYYKINYSIITQYKKDFPYYSQYLQEVVSSSDQDFKDFSIDSQNTVNEKESIEFDVKLYPIAISNFGKFTSHFDEKDAPYRLDFQNKKANITYKKMMDDYSSRFQLLLSNQPQDTTTQSNNNTL